MAIYFCLQSMSIFSNTVPSSLKTKRRRHFLISAADGLFQGSATFFNKRAILLHLPADMTGEEPQNVDDVLFFMGLHSSIG